MNNVYVLAKKRDATFGHGDYGSEYVIADTYTPTHPAFSTRDAAERYFGTLESWRRSGLEVIALRLDPSSPRVP